MISQEPINNLTASDIQKQLAVDLLELCTDDILGMMSKLDTSKSYSIELNLVNYLQLNIFLCELIFREPGQMIPLLDNALLISQKYLKKSHQLQEHLTIKLFAKVRLSRLLVCERSFVPRASLVGKLISLTGKVVRTGMVKVLETQRTFECQKCGMRFPMNYDREQYNLVPKPFQCRDSDCGGSKFKEVVSDEIGENPCRDYQEIKVQEDVSKLNMGHMPRAITVVLEDDLVDQCKAGDNVSVIGIVSRRWKSFVVNERCSVEIFLLANNIVVHNRQFVSDHLSDETRDYFDQFWLNYQNKPIEGRNEILKMFCPRIWGMFVIKLAIMMVLEGGASKDDEKSFRTNSHLLLVGDPGTGKSQFLKNVARLMPRSVQTTGVGSTSAGLTVAAVKDSGGWQLEAGALVLADRGVCCIDEFNSMRESDKTSLHEAMEQQTISVAKAGLVCQLQTRCSIIASTNPKGKYDPYKEAEINIGISSPLLSRFDLIFILMDTQNLERDESVSSFLLNAELQEPEKRDNGTLKWDLQKLQQYIQYTKLKFEPDISEAANQVLTAYYQFCRNSDGSEGPRTTIRLFEGLIRLTQSHARLIFRTSARVEDAVTAIFIMEHSIHRRMLNESWNIYDDFPSDPTEDYYRNEDYILSKLNLKDLSTRNQGTFENPKNVNSQISEWGDQAAQSREDDASTVNVAQDEEDLTGMINAAQEDEDNTSVISWEPSPQMQSTKRPKSVSPENSSPPRKFHASLEADEDLFIADLDFLE